MVGGVLTQVFDRQIVIEAGTLSYLPVYSKLAKKEVTSLFGKDVCKLIQEVETIRSYFADDQDDLVKKCSLYAKNIYLAQCYLDLVLVFTNRKKNRTFVIDGEEYIVKKNKVKCGNETVKYKKFCSHIVEILEWKMDYLQYGSSDIRMAIWLSCVEYKKQKGYEFEFELNKIKEDENE